MTAFLIFQIISGVFLFVPPPQQVQAVNQNWTFATASNYTYDNTKIEISSGQSQLKETSNWYNADWGYRRTVTIDNTENDNDLTNYQVQVSVIYDSDMQVDFDDIRFTDSNGTNLINYWLETKIDSTSATFWVEVPSISASSTESIYMYYGNLGTNSDSDGDATFINFIGNEEVSYERSWTKYSSNPILNAWTDVNAESWEDYYLYAPRLLYEGGIYKMWYSGGATGSVNKYDIGYATSSDGYNFIRDTANNPVMTDGNTGDFDELGVAESYVINDNGTYKMWYSGEQTGKIQIGYATSPDGISWTKYSTSPVLPTGADLEWDSNWANKPSVIKENDTSYKMWYTGKANIMKIGYATSPDGINWTKHISNPVLNAGAYPNVIYEDGIYKMWYIKASGGGYETFYAESNDGINWTEKGVALRKGASGEWDDNYISTPFVLKLSSSSYKLYYSGRKSGDAGKYHMIGVANDGIPLPDLEDWDLTQESVSGTNDYPHTGIWGVKMVGSIATYPYLIESTNMIKNRIYEVWVYDDMSTISNFQHTFRLKDDSTPHPLIGLWMGQSTTKYIYRPKGGGWTDTAINRTEGWHKFSFKVGTSTTEAYIDNTLIFTENNLDEDNLSSIGFYGYSAGTGYIDDLIVRGYTSPEPSTSIGSEISLYPSDDPTIQPTAINFLIFTSLSVFTETATKNGGEIKYILSNDDGSTWHYYNFDWVISDGTYSQANTATDINSNISTFPVGSGEFLFKAFLHSDGAQLVQLDSIQLTYISNTAPSVSFDNDFSTWETGDVTVNYNLIDAENDSLNISQGASSGIEYSSNGSTWADATDAGGISEGLTGLASSASSGTDHIFAWNSLLDLVSTEDSTVYLRIKPNDGTVDADAWATSNAFGIDNVAPSAIGVSTFGTITASSIEVNKPTVVTENGSGLYQWQARRDSATELGLNVIATTSDTDTDLSENTQYTYDAQFKDNANNLGNYGTTASKYTLTDTPTNLSASAQSTTQINVSVDTFPNYSADSSAYYFANTTATTNSDWQSGDNTWSENNLLPNTQYTYQTKYRNGDGTETSSIEASKYTLIQTPTAISFDDVGVNTLTVSATGTLSNLTSGSSGLYFDETSDEDGGTDSSWLQTNLYQNIGLSENTQYTFRVKARNGNSAETSYTAASSQYTLVDTPTNLTGTSAQYTMDLSVDSLPNNTSDLSGYYFENTATGSNSGWIQTNSWNDTGLICNTPYAYTIKYRNGDGVETDTISLTKFTDSCGGGSTPSGSQNPPEPPIPTLENPKGEFKILINNGDEITNNRTVNLKLSAGSDTTKMIISENSDFKNSIQKSYQETRQWALSYGDGIKTIYVKFYTQYGIESETVSDSIVLDSGLKKEIKSDKPETAVEDKPMLPIEKDKKSTPLPKTSIKENIALNPIAIVKNLKYGSNNNQVVQLQDKLKQLNLFSEEIKSNGNFGPATIQAVKEFQKSVGIYPCGIVGPRTRKALNNQEFITNKDYQFTEDLKYNNQGEEVKQLQTRLRDQSFFPYYVKSTGWFGPTTKTAVKLFQKFHGIIENGIVRELVRGKLNL